MPILHPPPPPSVTSSVTIAAPPTSPPSQTQIPASQSQPAQDITPTDANSNTQNSSKTSPAPTPTVHADPQITLSFLHISGRRRTLSFPADTTVARVKEVVWNTWPKEWYDGSSGGVGGGLQNEGGGGRDSLKDELPAAPGFIRLFCLGKMWTDESRLSGELSFFFQRWIVGFVVRFCFWSFVFVSFWLRLVRIRVRMGVQWLFESQVRVNSSVESSLRMTLDLFDWGLRRSPKYVLLIHWPGVLNTICHTILCAVS